MNTVSALIIPLIILSIIIYGYKKKINIYESFLSGAKEGLITTFKIAPAMLAMIFAVNIFLSSGFITFAFAWSSKLLSSLNLPINILPMAILRPLSGSATLAILNDIFKSMGPDSFAGRVASVIQGCTDTTLYVIALYYGSIGIKKTRYTLGVGLLADLVGLIAALVVSIIFFW